MVVVVMQCTAVPHEAVKSSLDPDTHRRPSFGPIYRRPYSVFLGKDWKALIEDYLQQIGTANAGP